MILEGFARSQIQYMNLYFIFIMKDLNENTKDAKSYDFESSEFNREMKIDWQRRVKKGLPVSVDIPNDADEEDLAYLNAFRDWLDDGKPVKK